MAGNNTGKGYNEGDCWEYYEKRLEFCPYAVMILKENHVCYSNDAALRLLRLDRDRIKGKPISELLNGYSDQLPGYASKSRIAHPDGTEIQVEILAVLKDMLGKEESLVILRERGGEPGDDKSESDNNSVLDIKNDFFSNLSHELRTPLNVIMSTIQLMESMLKNSSASEIIPKIKKYIGIMKQNCFRQLRLINNIIDISKIDSGFYEIEKRNYDIVHIVENITMSVSDYVKSKAINLLFDTDMEEKIIACDGDKIERIMLNLLSNAIKFTPEGGNIFVTVHNKGESVEISVRDTGIGIPEDKLGLVFNRFMQVDKSFARKNQGSGIGLSLVKSLVELHGGSISVKSEIGKGSEFIIELPATTVPETEDCLKEDTRGESGRNSFVEKIDLEFSDIYKIT